jgi:uncharacterized protein
MSTSHTRDAHLFGAGRKRILTLDGGGVRGALTIAFLEKLEAEIGAIEGRPTRLGEWFDLIGGTSTGAILATGLALGYRAGELKDFYHRLGPKIFKRSRLRVLGWQSKFDFKPLMNELQSIIGARTLDSEDLLTGLCVVLKRFDTGSAWMVMNNPRSVYWETPPDSAFVGNRHMPLANLVRASTAAPGFFDPQLIEIIKGEPPGAFVDGGLTPHNNPALLVLMAALLPAYGLKWALGPDKLTIVSVGTGSFRSTMASRAATRLTALGLALRSLAGMIHESEQLVMTLMTYLGQSPVAWPINSEIGDLGPLDPPGGPLFRFLRYDVKLETAWLRDQLGETVSDVELDRLRQMDDPAIMPTLDALGRKAAQTQVRRENLV